MAAGTMTARAVRFSWGFYAWITVLALLVAQGLVSFFRQTFQGHYLTGLSDALPWGLYISGFVFFVGASAGATVIGLLIHAFGRKEFEPLGTRAILVGLLSLTAAVLFITVDVGSIPRMVRLPFIWRNPTSMFMYTALTYYAFGLLLLGELFYTLKVTRGAATAKDKKVVKWLAIAAVPFALVILHAPHGALFAVVKAREFWNTPLLPPHFAVVALVSGASIMILVAAVTAKVRNRELLDKEALSLMGVLLALFISVAAFMDFFDFLVFTYTDKPTGGEAWHFLSGPHLVFSVIHVGGYILALLILLTQRGRRSPWLTVAAAVAVAAVAAYRYNLTTVGMSISLYSFVPHEHYLPTWVEISITVGIVSLVLLAYSVLTRLLPMEERASDSGQRGQASS